MAAASQSIWHIGIRYAALASKPALIWLLVALGNASAAVEVGSLMLVAALIGMAMSNEAHLKLYAAVFGNARRSDRALFGLLTEYLHALVTHIVLIFIPAFLLCMLFFPKVDPLLAVGLALAERVADELLRIRLYRKEWNRWTLLLLAKNLIPAATVVAALFLAGRYVGLAYALAGLVFAFGLLASEGPFVRKGLEQALRRLPDLQYIRSYLVTYFRILSTRQIAAILSMNVVLLDRYVGMNVWSEVDLAYMLLTGQIVNGIFFALEAKFLSEHRANFINPDARMAVFWRWPPYIILMGLCLVAATAALFVGTNAGLLPTMPLALYVAAGLVVVCYAAFYISVPLNDYLYYRGMALPLAIGHTILFAFYGVLVVTIAALQPPAVALALLTILLVLRMLVLNEARKRLDRALDGVATN